MIKKFWTIIFILILIIPLIPRDVQATTLREYEEALEKYKNDLDSTNYQISVNKKELEELQAKIAEIDSQIQEAQDEIQRLEEEIQKNNEEIEKKKEQSKRLMEYYQISNGENIYLEYAFGASDITDMVYRLAIVEQLTDYNDKVMTELKELIKKNQERQKELEEKQVELNGLRDEARAAASKVQGSISSLAGEIPNLQGQLENYERRVSYYKSQGCQPDDVIGQDCAKENYADGWVIPVTGSYWMSTYYYWDGYSGHKGLDYAQGCGNPVRAVANGTVYYVGSDKDIYGAKMVMIVHNYNGRKIFSLYAHLSGYAVSENDKVVAGQTIGYVGSTGWSTGCHLHLEMSVDVGWDYNWPGNYWTYTQYIINPYDYVPR